jgi:glyoxylase-like metal-dependent hydrolase (beta-lactamase superfamily II)
MVRRRDLLKLGLVGGSAELLAPGLLDLSNVATEARASHQAPFSDAESIADLTRIAMDTFLFRYEDYVSLFIVTDDGVILMDPNGGINPLGKGNPHAPSMMKEAIRSVTDQLVRYVIYSHAAPDHGTGGIVFADTAQFVGHTTTRSFLANRADPVTPVPEITFASQRTIELGGTAVHLYHADLASSGPSRSYIILHHPAARLVMFTDLARIETLPFGAFLHGHPDRTVEALSWIDEQLEFDAVVWGHASPRVIGTRADLRSMQRYILDLSEAIENAGGAELTDASPFLLGSVREQLQPQYGSWRFFDEFLEANVEGMVRWRSVP